MIRLLHTVAVVAAVAAVAAGCAARRPAPVVDRTPAPVAKPAAPAAQAPAPARPETYVVRRGDTLYSIALDQGVDWRELAALNQLTDPTRLRVGQELVIRPAPAAPQGPVVVMPVAPAAPVAARPLGAEAGAVPPPAGAPAQAGAGQVRTEPKGLRLPYSEENLALVQRSDSARFAAPVPPAAKPEPPPATTKPEPPAAAKPEPPAAAKPEAESGEDRVDWAWPAAGKVVGNFNGGTNKGLDISARLGDPVYASAAGKVVYSGEGIPAYGKLIIIRHNGTYLSAYAHNSQIVVKEGQNVAKGQKIAEVGATGTEQPKLHFEIRRSGKPVDPSQYLPPR